MLSLLKSDFAKDCSTVFSNLGKAKSTEIKSFRVSKVNGETVMEYQVLLIFKKNTPPLTRQWGFSFNSIPMTTIKIDNVDYDTDKLSDEAKAQLVSLQF